MTTSLPKTPAICSPYANEPPPAYKKHRTRRRARQVLSRALRSWLGSEFVSLL